MDRYVGLDAHAETCTLAVMSPSGRRLSSQVVETNRQSLVEAVRAVPGQVHLCLEEGSRARLAARDPRAPRVRTDGDGSAEEAWLEGRSAGRVVSSERSTCGDDRDPCVVSVKNRSKSVFRSRGISTQGEVYGERGRPERLALLPAGPRGLAEWLYKELDVLVPLRADAEERLLTEEKRHPITRKLKTAPGLGPLRTAQLVTIVMTPHRFRTSRQLWSYCGVAVITHSSSDWVRSPTGAVVRGRVQQTRGLTRKRQPVSKEIFKGVATTVITQLGDHPLCVNYYRQVNAGMRPNLAKVTLARRIAAIVLSMWKHEDVNDPTRVTVATDKN